jgi:hypothetical protein
MMMNLDKAKAPLVLPRGLQEGNIAHAFTTRQPYRKPPEK